MDMRKRKNLRAACIHYIIWPFHLRCLNHLYVLQLNFSDSAFATTFTMWCPTFKTSHTLIFLLILYAFSPSQCIALVDQIWHWKASDGSFEIVYIITSHTPLAADALLGSFAKLHHSRIHMDDDSKFFDDAVQECVENRHLFHTDSCPPPEHVGYNIYAHDAEREKVTRETFLRKARLWRMARSEFESADYFVFLDFRAADWLHLGHDQLLNFQSLLVLEKPVVAVPFHHCNTMDAPSRTSTLHNHTWSMISSIHDTKFIAVHTSARKLLLPLHESVLSLVCHLFLKSRVVQFDLGNLKFARLQGTGCREADVANQDSMFNFVSSLKGKQYILAVPFSPRISRAAAPINSPVQFTLDGIIETSLSEKECPIDCNFYYWQIHPAFECCSLFSDAAPLYNAKENYLKLSQTYMVPRIESISGILMDQNYSTDLVGRRAQTIPCGRKGNHSCYIVASDYTYRSELTHPFQKFEILLSTHPVILDNACADRDLSADFFSLKHFRLTVLPELMNLIQHGTESSFQIQIQFVLSAHNAPHSEYENCAVFARISRLQVALACDAEHKLHVFDDLDVNLQQKRQHDRPWFYDPNFSSFEVTPSMLTDALRYHSVNVSMRTSCSDIVNVTLDASVELRSYCDFSNTPASCISHVLNATSQTTSHHSREEKRRSAFTTNAQPNDLFDVDRLSAHDQIKLPRRLLSDFTCAGPNRKWNHADEADFFNYGPNSRLNFSGYSMCLLRNVCFENQKMVMYVPHYFANLPDFLDFSHVKVGDEEIEFAPSFVFDSFIPAKARFAANIAHYAMMIPTPDFNFGHRVWEDLGGIFHAMHLFDLPRDDGRVVLFNSHSMPRNQVLSFFPRATAYIDEYPDGTCFQQMVVGFRGMNAFKHGFSLHRTAHSVEFRKHYLKVLNAEHLTAKTRRRPQVIVNMYPKVVKGNKIVWKDICKLIENAEILLPKVLFRCIALHKMSFEVQVQVISEATVNIWPNGMQSKSMHHAHSHVLM
jgi:hypothetical protein